MSSTTFQVAPNLIQYSAPAAIQAAAGAMWAADQGWAPQAALVDGRVCGLLGDNPRPVGADGRCPGGGDASCTWAYYNVNVVCDATSFERVLFQGQRYNWAQAQLRALLAARPAASSVTDAEACADWSIRVLRLVALARWSTNIRPDFLLPIEEGPAVAAVREQIMSYRPGAAPSKLDARDQVTMQDVVTELLVRPRSFTPPVGGTGSIPTSAQDFDPVWVGQASELRRFDARVLPQNFRTRGGLSHNQLYPFDLMGTSPPNVGAGAVGSSRARDALVAWYRRSLGSTGSGWWWGTQRATGVVLGYVGCPSGTGQLVNYCERRVQPLRHWWWSGSAHMALFAAMAQDVVSTPYGVAVAAGLDHFLELYSQIPEALRISDRPLAELRAELRREFAARMTEAQTAFTAGFAVASAAAGPVGWVVGIAGLVVSMVLELLKHAGVAGFGGGIVEQYCLPPPVIRMIGGEGLEAGGCDFRTSDGQLARTAAQSQVIAELARVGAPVSLWFEASRNVARQATGQAPILGPDGSAGGGSEAQPFNWKPWLIGGAAVLGGALVWRGVTR